MWESLAELIDAGLGDREPPPRTTTAPVVAVRLEEFRRAARTAVRRSGEPRATAVRTTSPNLLRQRSTRSAAARETGHSGRES
jgi:hypothetical protein